MFSILNDVSKIYYHPQIEGGIDKINIRGLGRSSGNFPGN